MIPAAAYLGLRVVQSRGAAGEPHVPELGIFKQMGIIRVSAMVGYMAHGDAALTPDLIKVQEFIAEFRRKGIVNDRNDLLIPRNKKSEQSLILRSERISPTALLQHLGRGLHPSPVRSAPTYATRRRAYPTFPLWATSDVRGGPGSLTRWGPWSHELKLPRLAMIPKSPLVRRGLALPCMIVCVIHGEVK